MTTRTRLVMGWVIGTGLVLLWQMPGRATDRAAQTQPTTQESKEAKGDAVFPKPPAGIHKVTFVCDASGSMLNKFSSLRRAIDNALQEMPKTESFGIIFMREQSCTPLGMTPATAQAKLAATNFMEDKIVPRGETDPIPAIEAAFKQEPQLIYLLSDGDFPDNQAVQQQIRQLNKDHKVKIFTIAFVNEMDTDTAFITLLKQIASENDGVYKHVVESNL